MAKNVYDILIIGGGQAGVPLAHALRADGLNVALAERKRLGGTCVNYGCTPTKAAIASARVAVDNVAVARLEMKENGKASEMGETDGFIKVVVDADTDRILGAAVLAAEGAELVHAYIDLMNAGAPYTVVRDAIHIHPTLSEAVQSVLTSFNGRA